MKWGEWEIIRHQVAICGRVLDDDDKSVAKAQVSIASMPKEFTTQVTAASDAAGAKWADLDERLDRTLSRTDGIFYFLDLPSGQYTLQVRDTRSGSQDEKKLSVSWDKEGKVKRGVADLRISTSS